MPFPLFCYTFLLLLFLLPPPCASRNLNPWRNFTDFIDLEKGSSHPGIPHLKNYFLRFGYLNSTPPSDQNHFDELLESAVLSYQKNLGLPVTGKLDSTTVELIMSPRCGIRDNHNHMNHMIHATKHYAFFSGKPRWSTKSTPVVLTYAFSESDTIDYIPALELRAAFNRSFARWSAAIPVSFVEAAEYATADVKIGFHGGDHGDGKPFDGVLGILAHAFSPENGRLHLDAAERWAVDFGREDSKVAVDLESVATHEIGHVLGLAHSSMKESIMYPSLSPRVKKRELRVDDVAGVQALYGSNPGFNFGSLLASEESSEAADGGRWFGFLVMVGLLCGLVVI